MSRWDSEHRVGECCGQGVVVLLERILGIMEHESFQRLVDIVRLGKPITPLSLIDNAVVDQPVTTETISINVQCRGSDFSGSATHLICDS